MAIDARTIAEGLVLETQVCIIGAGPAGITLAHELAGENIQVALLESGGYEADGATQQLAASEGDLMCGPYPNAYWTRGRRLGGTAHQWNINLDQLGEGVRYVPLDEIDLEQKDWMPLSGWPWSRAELDPYYDRAQQVCQIGPNAYDPQTWQGKNALPFEFASGNVITKMFQCGPRNAYLKTMLGRIEQAANVTTYLHATAVELQTDDSANTVTQVQVAVLDGARFSIRAQIVVLALGGIENARLLLLSDQVQPSGLGNGHDLVGRYLMDHQMIRAGLLRPPDRVLFRRMALYDLRDVNSTHVIGKFLLDPALIRREQLLNTATALFPRHGFFNSDLLRRFFPRGRNHQSPAVSAYRNYAEAIKRGQLPDQPWLRLKEMATHWDQVLGYKARLVPLYSHPSNDSSFDRGGWSARPHPEQEFGAFDVVQLAEQSPDAANRITLGRERDALGCRKGKLEWRWSETDMQKIFRIQAILQEEFARAGLGQLQLRRDYDWPELIQSSIHHPMGTTRMHDSPRQGVVDGQGQVHGVANLFVTGSSVFPTGGYANPTLTIVAIALRLADQVKLRMSQQVVKL